MMNGGQSPSPLPPADVSSYDAVLLLSFGGPERPDDVVPFLENVTSGRNVPAERLREVAAHYELFGGVSPHNAANRALLVALVSELNARGPHLPVYWGNRHWHPLLADTLRQMADDGIRRALAFVTSPFGSYPGCRQYLEAIERARAEVGAAAPQVDKIRLFYNHPGFIEATADRASAAFEEIPIQRCAAARLIYSAHSIPVVMARRCPYQSQLREACALVSDRVGRVGLSAQETVPLGVREVAGVGWDLVYQSRGGPPSQPWLGPAVGDYLRELARRGDVRDVVLVPIGFVGENMEVVYDLDVEVGRLCDELGVNMVRAEVVGCHPRFVAMIRELIEERLSDAPTRPALGSHGPFPDQCPPDCCRPT